MKAPHLFFILLFICFSTSAQVSFKEGYYINNSNDTIAGLIKDYDWNQNPAEILFKNNETGLERKLQPKDILGFGIKDKVMYSSREVQLDQSEDDINKLSVTRLPDYKVERVFLKVLEKGKASLFEYRTETNTRFYFETDSRDIEMLIFKKYLDQNSKVRENNNFRQQLLNNLSACDELSTSSFKNLTYKEKDLRRLIFKYNTCSGKLEFSQQEKKRKKNFNISLRPGFQLGNFTVANNAGREFDFEQEASFTFGIELEYILPFDKNRWRLILEPTYQSFSSQKEFLVQDFLRRSGEVTYTSIDLPIGLRYYSYLNQNHQIFLNSGVNFGFNVGDNELKADFVPSITKLNHLLSPFIGLGYKFKQKFSAEIRYTFPRDLLYREVYNTSNQKARLTTLAFMIGYKVF